MKIHRNYFLFIPFAIAMVMFFVLPGFASPKKDLKPTVAGKSSIAAKAGKSSKAAKIGKLSPKVQEALDIIKNGTSEKSMGNQLLKLKLSEKDKKALSKELKKKPYAGILKRFSNQAQRKAKSSAKAKTASLNRQAEQKHQQTIRSLNQQAMAKLAPIKARVPKSLRLLSGQTMASVSMSQLMGGSSGPRANVTGVSPETAVVGGNATIEGENFGTDRRKVYLILGGEGYECPVNSWSETRIRVTIPNSLAGIIGETTKNAEICVVLKAYSHDIRIAPDPAGLRAAISDLSSRTITPGQTLVIEGEKFLTESRGSVTFRFGSRDINGQISEWADNYIVAVLPGDVEGLREVAGIVKVRNHAGHEDTRSITFEPIIVARTLPWSHHWANACFFGQLKEWTDFDFRLINGWTVLRYWLDIEKTTSCGGW